jgi:hypothetical protein
MIGTSSLKRPSSLTSRWSGPPRATAVIDITTDGLVLPKLVAWTTVHDARAVTEPSLLSL